MAESERSAAEREAARLERERRRAAEDGFRSDPSHFDAAPHDGEALEAADAEPEAELPLGTRRASRRERVAAAGRPRRPQARAHRQRRGRGRGPAASRRIGGPRRWLGRAFALLTLGLAAAIIWFAVKLFEPFHGSGHGRVTVVVPPHTGARQIGNLLARDGVVASGFFFNLRAELAGDRGKLLAGTYHLKLGMSYGDVLTALTTAPPAAKTSNLTLIEGLSRSQISNLLRSQHIPGNYLLATRHSRLLDPRRYGAPRSTPSLEGFLFPSTYQLRDPITVAELVSAQLRSFKQEFAGVSMHYAAARHLTPYEVLIIASMVQAEAQTAHDRPLIASVIYNRLADSMPLQIDATTRYATGNYTKPLTVSQLSSSSPYNTRIHKGLPPTPIDNPGLAAIQAAANPARTNYLYFVAKPCGNGAHAFSSNYAQFLRDAARYQAARAKRGGRSPEHC